MKRKASKTNVVTIAILLVTLTMFPVIQTGMADDNNSPIQESIVDIYLT